MHRPLIERRARLLELLRDLPHVHVIAQTSERGEEMYQAAVGLGLEGNRGEATGLALSAMRAVEG